MYCQIGEKLVLKASSLKKRQVWRKMKKSYKILAFIKVIIIKHCIWGLRGRQTHGMELGTWKQRHMSKGMQDKQGSITISEENTDN